MNIFRYGNRNKLRKYVHGIDIILTLILLFVFIELSIIPFFLSMILEFYLVSKKENEPDRWT